MFTRQHYQAVADILIKNGCNSDGNIAKDFRAMFWNDNNNFDDRKWNEYIDTKAK